MAGEDGLLGDKLALGSREHHAADLTEYSPSVFSRTTQKSISPGLLVGQRARHARQQADWAEVDVLVELSPDRHQQTPKGDVVRHAREADRAQEDGVRLS